MIAVKAKFRQIVTSLFFLSVELMTLDPPLWAFRCSRCQDKDGRWRTFTADGILLDYLKRLPAEKLTNGSE